MVKDTRSLNWKRAVIKVGSSLIAPDGDGCQAKNLLPIAQFISSGLQQGKEIILVSSGSVAAGKHAVKVTHTPTIAEKQAMAAVGQTQMMANWQRFFDQPCAQVLLTYDDLKNRTRYVNIKNTLSELLKHGAIPVVNENDTVAVNELKVGDNDNLAAYAALVGQADTLIICSDVDGLFDADPRKNKHAKLIDTVDTIDDSLIQLAGGAGSAVGTGGMMTKLQAAQRCMQSGIQTLIVNGTNPDVFLDLSANRRRGTLFTPQCSSLKARQLWLTQTLASCGTITIDAGAKNAVVTNGASLLASGIVDVHGDFSAGDAITVMCNGEAIAKGLALLDSQEMNAVKGKSNADIQRALGYASGSVMIHRDDMVLLK